MRIDPSRGRGANVIVFALLMLCPVAGRAAAPAPSVKPVPASEPVAVAVSDRTELFSVVHADLHAGRCADAASVLIDLYEEGLVDRPATVEEPWFEGTLYRLLLELRSDPGVRRILESRPFGVKVLEEVAPPTVPVPMREPSALAADLAEIVDGLGPPAEPGADACLVLDEEPAVGPATKPAAPGPRALPALSDSSKKKKGERKRRWYDKGNLIVLIVVSAAAASATGFGIYSAIARR